MQKNEVHLLRYKIYEEGVCLFCHHVTFMLLELRTVPTVKKYICERNSLRVEEGKRNVGDVRA